MSKYKVVYAGEEQDEIFDTEDEAEKYAWYLQSCEETGAEMFHLSNPGDYEYDEETFEPAVYEIIEID